MFPRRTMRNIGVITLDALYDLEDAVSTPTDASIGFRLNSDGNIETQTGTGAAWVSVGTWKAAGDVAANYESLATLNSGSVSSGTTGSRQAQDTTRTWTRVRTNNADGSDVADLTIAIYPIGALSPSDSASVVLTATVVV